MNQPISLFNQRQTMEKSTFEIFHYYDKNPSNVSLHHHDFFELYYLVSGKMEYVVEGCCYLLEPGNMLLIAPNELHHPNALNQESLERIVVWISIPLLTSLTEKFPDILGFMSIHAPTHCNFMSLNPSERIAVADIFNDLLKELSSPEYASVSMQHLYLMQLLVKINRIVLRQPTRTPHPALISQKLTSSNQTSLSDVFDYINNHLSENLTLANLSHQFYFDANTLTRKFKKHANVTVCEYIRKKRLATAMLKIHQQIPLTKISISCGFRDYSTFYRTFKQEYGISPKEFAAMCKS